MSNTALLASRFPRDFLFGVATASYQIEGAVDADGRKPCIWDTFAAQPGKVVNGDSGAVACDHYHLWESDLDLLSQYGVDAYRFSIAWPRIVPDGRGPINQKGLDWYERLVDGLIARDIKVFPTLYHWDLPQTLQDAGGWTHRDTAEAFADYVHAVVSRMGDRFDTLATFNEPFCSCYLGHLNGIHAPGIKNVDAAMRAVHTTNLAHGLAVQACRSVRADLPTGIVINPVAIAPASDSDQDIAAAERYFQMYNGAFFSPLLDGRYDDQLVEALGSSLGIQPGDLENIHQPLDWWGLNYYTPTAVVDNRTDTSVFPHAKCVEATNTGARTDIGWEIDAAAMSRLLVQLNERYTLPPCYITENGACYNTELDEHGVVDDQARLSYLADHLNAAADAIDAGVDLRGYLAWSLLDNYEWAEGYSMRFGLTHVDYETQVRTVKNSGHWYGELIGAHRDQRP